MGGRPNASSATLFQQCTHAVLLLREDEPEATKTWLDLIERYNQMLLARLISRQTGNSMITQRLPVLEGTICGLERHTLKDSYGETFQVLVDRIASVFSSYNLQDQKEAYLQHASTELVLDLDSDLRKYTTSTKWAPEMLTPYLASLPAKTPLSVYGVGPNWLIAALAAYTDQQTLYQFDPKLPFGWAQPARVRIGATREPSSDLHVEKREEQDLTVLSISFPQDRIDYFDPQIRTFPDLDPAKGLILNGRLPFWLLTALTRLYQARGVRWIAPYNAIEDAAIVAWSRVDFPGIAARILMPQTQQQK
jgi:CRISPR-associated protein Csx3